MVSWFRRNKPESAAPRRLSTEDLAAMVLPDSTRANVDWGSEGLFGWNGYGDPDVLTGTGDLLAELGEPILSSSLILPGEAAPLNDPDAIAASVGRRIDAFLDAGPCSGEASTVRQTLVIERLASSAQR